MDLLAEFWLRLDAKARFAPRDTRESLPVLELHLTGFTRSAAETVSNEMTRRFSETDLPFEVSALDPDTLVAKTKPSESTTTPVPGFGLSALNGAPFDGLLLEIRFTATDPEKTDPAPPATEHTPGSVGAVAGVSLAVRSTPDVTDTGPESDDATLVIIGELRGGTVAVKAVWIDSPFEARKRFWNEPFPSEDQLLAAFDEYRIYKKVDEKPAGNLYLQVPEAVDLGPMAIADQWLIVPFGRPRLRGLLLRGAFLLSTLPIFATFFVIAKIQKWPYLPVVFLCLFLMCLTPAFRFIRQECRQLFTYQSVRSHWNEYFRSHARYAAIQAGELSPWQHDLAVQKLTAEILEAGFIHAGDGAAIPTDSADVVHRIFLAPDGVSYLAIAFRFAFGVGSGRGCVWPAQSWMLCQTFFADGSRLETFSSETVLMKLGRQILGAEHRTISASLHPSEFSQTHEKTVKELCAETGVVGLRHAKFDITLKWQNDIAEQERQTYWARPYSLRDHIRWYLQLDATPSSESK